MRLGEALIELKLIAPEQLETALAKQKENRKRPLGEQNEAYAVSYRDGTATLANWELPSAILSLSAGEVVALTALATHGTFAIRQRGDRAISEPLTLNLS